MLTIKHYTSKGRGLKARVIQEHMIDRPEALHEARRAVVEEWRKMDPAMRAARSAVTAEGADGICIAWVDHYTSEAWQDRQEYAGSIDDRMRAALATARRGG